MSPAPPFNPNAPPVKLTGDDISAMRADMNKVAIKLHEATGIQLYGFYKIHDLVPYWGPLGFDFMCDNWRQLLDAADKNPRLGFDLIDMPGYDPWRNARWKASVSRDRQTPARASRCCDRPAWAVPDLHSWRNDDDRARCAAAGQTGHRERLRCLPAHLPPAGQLGVDLDEHIGAHLEARGPCSTASISSPRITIGFSMR